MDELFSTRAHGPDMLSLITTYRCTASCAECCFGCSPHASAAMSLPDLKAHIDIACEAFDTVRAVVFTGGECFLLREDLVKAVAHATACGLGTRCVTNGYWGTSRRAAEKRLQPLIEAGLKEINFSTGSEHQRFVPYDRVALAATTANELGLVTVVSVEMSGQSSFTLDAARDHAVMRSHFARQAKAPMFLMASVWTELDGHSTQRVCEGAGVSRKGCDSLFRNIAIEPDGTALGCCGLTSTRIPELVLGTNLPAPKLKAAYEGQYEDLVKLWLSIDGPVQIAHTLGAGDEPAWRPASHQCAACIELFSAQRHRDALRAVGPNIAPDVAFRFAVRERLLAARGASGGTAPSLESGPQGT